MGKEKLKSCPFCGNCDIVIWDDKTIYSDENILYWVRCLNCKAESGWDLDKKGAIEKWNIRIKS